MRSFFVRNKILKQKYSSKLLLLLVLALALFIRLYDLDQLRLTHDEMSIGFNAHTIALTGQDEWGTPFPLAFKAFGDWKLPGYIYATVPFVKFLGLNNYSVKLPSVIAGLMIVFGLFTLAKKLTKNDWLGLLAALIAALSPWSIHLSRMGLESNLALAFFIWGIIFFFNLLKEKKRWWPWAVLAGLSMGAAFYTYVAFRLILALFWLAIFSLSFFYKIEKKKIALALAVFILAILPLTSLIFGQSGTARFAQVSIFSDPGVVAQVNKRRTYCYLVEPNILPKLCQLVFNKPQVYLAKFTQNYLQFILPSFLFLNGDKLEYLSDPGFGEFAWILLPFYLIGLVGWLKRNDYFSNLIKIGFLIAPIPAALVGDPQIVRGSVLLPFVIIFIVFGIEETWKLINNKIVKRLASLATVGLFLFLTANYLVHYLFIYPRDYQAYFYPMGEEVGKYLLSEYSYYDEIYISDNFPDAHILLAFLAEYDPEWYQNNVQLPEPDKFGFQHPTRLDKFVFNIKRSQNLICDPKIKNALYVGGGAEDILHTKEFKGFSGVHTQVKIMDIDMVRKELSEKGVFNKWCDARNTSP